MDIHALTTEDGLALAKQVTGNAVQLTAIEYNWGPPVAGRFDSDFMNIWAAAPAGAGTNRLVLQGQRINGDWSIEIPFEEVASFTNSDHINCQFFSLALAAQEDFPTQFVLRLEPRSGETRYDNNHGQNYRVEPYRGRGISAVRNEAAIYDLRQILPCQLLWAKYPPERAQKAGVPEAAASKRPAH